MANLSNINNKFLVTTGGNVGINTTSPNSKLDVTGGDITVNTTGTGFMNFKYSGNSIGSIQTDGLDIKINATSDLVLLPGSNVGIGTTSPSSKLEVKMNDAANNRLGFTGDGSTTGAAMWTNWQTGNSYLDFRLGGTTDTYTKMRITNAGNVGIGSDAPEKKLHVKGTTSNATPQVLIQNSSTGDASVQYNVSGQSYVMGIDYDDSKKFKIASSGNLGTTDRVTLLSTGQVGIGTITPATKLQVANAGEVIVRSSMTAADGYRGGFEADNQHTGGTIWSMFSTNNSDGYFGGGKFVIANESMGGVDANTTSKFVIDGSGNVGIGTTSPSYPLEVAGVEVSAKFIGDQAGHVQGSILLSSNTTDTPEARGQGVYRFNEGTDTTWYTGTAYANTNKYIWALKASTTSFDSGTAQLTYAMMTLTNGGNLGIGTTSPDLGGVAGTRVLTIASPTAERWGILELAGNRTWGGNQVGELKFISTDSTNNGTLVSLTAINDPTATGTGGSLKFSTRPNGGSLTERIRITSSGNVLIGDFASNGSIDPAQNGFGFQENGLGTASCNFTGTNEMFVFNQRDGQGTTQIDFRNGNVERGKIQWTTSGTTYNTISDYRVKENLKDFNGLNKVSKIKVYDFDWIESKKQDYGVIAHELQEILPLAVTGEKDGKKMQGVDYSKIVPLLVKSIQELKADNDILKAEIELLKNK